MLIVAHQMKQKISLNDLTKTLKSSSFELKKEMFLIRETLAPKRRIGQYLVFLDADCEVTPSFTKNTKNIIERKKGLFFIPFSSP